MLLYELYEAYPILYHMAWKNSWPSIEKNGLLSTISLMNLYRVNPEEQQRIARSHRPECVTVSCDGLSDAVIRDQKPMTERALTKALAGSMEPAEWYAILNSMVFFWPTKQRLETMLSANAYKGIEHDVLLVQTESLVKSHHNIMRLSAMNSGNTKPYPHPRSADTFKTLNDFPFEERKKKYGVGKAIAEVCFLDGIPDIRDHVVDVLRINIEQIDKIP